MSKKYKSMQEELAARRAAEASRSGPSGQGDPAGPRRSAEPGGSDPIEGFRRSVRAAGADTKKRFLKSSAESRQRRENRRAGSGPDPRDRGASYGHFQPQASAEKKFSFKMLFVILAITFAIIIFAFAATSYEFQRIFDQQHFPFPTDTTEPTETYPTQPAPAPGGALFESSSLSDIEEYVNANTIGTSDEQSLYGKPFSRISALCSRTGTNDTWYISEGRIYFWPKKPQADDPSEDIEQWIRFSRNVRDILKDADLEDTPVIIGYRDPDTWDLRMLMIDGEPVFLSDEYDTGAY